ncbi:hypothetical protein ACH4OX_30230 [Streptomyces roseolus]|uniref:hypothetical protein n=1 Tax=Streptomyces roseolus TaxID=67358 RepID=UPI00379B18DD
MPLVLVEGAIVRCNHQGRLRLMTGDPRVTVKGRGVVLAGKEGGLVFGSPSTPVPGMVSPCTAPAAAGGFHPCTISPATPDGWSTKLTVSGTPVLLATAGGLAVSGLGTDRWTVADPGQAVLETR